MYSMVRTIVTELTTKSVTYDAYLLFLLFNLYTPWDHMHHSESIFAIMGDGYFRVVVVLPSSAVAQFSWCCYRYKDWCGRSYYWLDGTVTLYWYLAIVSIIGRPVCNTMHQWYCYYTIASVVHSAIRVWLPSNRIIMFTAWNRYLVVVLLVTTPSAAAKLYSKCIFRDYRKCHTFWRGTDFR